MSDHNASNSSNAVRLVPLFSLLLLVGCQLPMANYLRDHVFPQDTTAKIALSPILFPTYAVTSVLDVTLINPIRGTRNVPEVARTLWEWEDDPAWVGKGVLLPVKIVAIPLGALGTIMFSEQFLYEPSSPVKPSQE